MKKTSILFAFTAYTLFSSVNFASELTIHAVGDVLLHKKLQLKGLSVGFDSLWHNVIPFIKKADISYANLEGPVAVNINRRGQEILNTKAQFKNIYTSFPMFNYHPSLVPALKSSGFDIVSTANNHSLDRYGIGVDKTIEQLNKYQLNFMGSKTSTKATNWYSLTNKKGLSLAWISCTQDTNGIKDHNNQILYCYKKTHQKIIFSLIKDLKNKVDGIIITPHWGKQYFHKPTKQQKYFAKKWLDAGALLILGSHPHVIQPIKKYKTIDGRLTYIAYSLGNFVSNQGSLKNRTSGVLAITLNKDAGLTTIKSIKLYPTYMQNRGGKLGLEWLTSKSNASYRLLKKVLGESYLKINSSPRQ